MDVESRAKDLIFDSLTPEQRMAVLESVRNSVAQAKKNETAKIPKNVALIVSILNKIESDIRSRYDNLGNAIENRVSSIKDGRAGINGKDGRDGKQGTQGVNGKNGADGRDGLKGIDGVSVTDAKIDFDGSLVITLSDGREINVGEVTGAASKTFINTAGGGGAIDTALFVQATFETVSKNLPSSNFTFTYNGAGQLTTITYSSGVVKTLGYNGAGDLTTVVLSGSTPAGITLTKTLTYTSGNLTSVAYT